MKVFISIFWRFVAVLFGIVTVLFLTKYLCDFIPDSFIKKYWIYGAYSIPLIWISGMVAIRWHVFGGER